MYVEKKGQSGPSAANSGIAMTGEPITAHVATHPYFPPSQNLIPAQGGRAFTRPSLLKTSPLKRTRSSLCGGQKCYAANATVISAMSLKTDRNPQDFVTASTPPPWFCIRPQPSDFFKITRRRKPGFPGETCTRQTKIPRQKASPGRFHPG